MGYEFDRKKKNILVEKPAFVSIQETEKIFNNKNFKNIFFGEGYMYRYHPQILKTIKIIEEGKIGKLISMETNFGVNLIYKKNFLGLNIKKLNKDKRIFNKQMGGGVILDHGCYTTSMSLLIASLIKKLDINNFRVEDIKTDYLENDIDVNSRAKINFDNKFVSYVSVSFTKNLGKRTSILGDSGKITLENSWNSNQNIMELSGKINKKEIFKNTKNIYTLEIENVSKDIIENKKESYFPGTTKKEIFCNSKLIDNWINE